MVTGNRNIVKKTLPQQSTEPTNSTDTWHRVLSCYELSLLSANTFSYACKFNPNPFSPTVFISFLIPFPFIGNISDNKNWQVDTGYQASFMVFYIVFTVIVTLVLIASTQSQFYSLCLFVCFLFPQNLLGCRNAGAVKKTTTNKQTSKQNKMKKEKKRRVVYKKELKIFFGFSIFVFVFAFVFFSGF